MVEDKNGNQWVWIPCYVEGGVGASTAGLNKYDRYDFPSMTSLYSEALDTKDQASVSQFGGYYIGRYEAGDGTVTNLDTPRLRTSSDGSGNTVTIKKGQAPYNNVIQLACVSLSKKIATDNNYDTTKMYTKLCSSYAWDTALMFIGGDYATNSIQGNYKSTTFSYTDIAGTENQPKNENESKLVPTGQTTAVKNIYDMGGNVWEYTTENWTRIISLRTTWGML